MTPLHMPVVQTTLVHLHCSLYCSSRTGLPRRLGPRLLQHLQVGGPHTDALRRVGKHSNTRVWHYGEVLSIQMGSCTDGLGVGGPHTKALLACCGWEAQQRGQRGVC